MRRTLLFSILLAVLGCATCRHSASTTTRIGPVDHQAGELIATLTSLSIQDVADNFPGSRLLYFLEVDGRDPEELLLQGVTGKDSQILRSSGCERYRAKGLSEANLYSIRDRKTKQSGVLIFIRIEKWLDGETAEVSYGWDHSTFSSRVNHVEMKRKEGKWSVERILMKVISRSSGRGSTHGHIAAS